ncbi:unnamed protein product, partial [Effrenium voratum]
RKLEGCQQIPLQEVPAEGGCNQKVFDPLNPPDADFSAETLRLPQRQSGRKIKKIVKYPLSLDISRFTSHPKREARYSLQGLVVHCGQSAKSGHYMAYAKHNGSWHRFNDEAVGLLSEQQVLSQEAYLLFYQTVTPPQVKEATATEEVNGRKQAMLNGQAQPHINGKLDVTNGLVNGKVNGLEHGKMNGLANGKINGLVNGKVNGKVNGVHHNGTHVEEISMKELHLASHQPVSSVKKTQEPCEPCEPCEPRSQASKRPRSRLHKLRAFEALRKRRKGDPAGEAEEPTPPRQMRKEEQHDVAERVATTTDYSRQYGQAEVDAWDSSPPEEQRQAFQEAQERLQPRPQKRDELDMDYDVGKKKHKPRKPQAAFKGSSAFDQE